MGLIFHIALRESISSLLKSVHRLGNLDVRIAGVLSAVAFMLAIGFVTLVRQPPSSELDGAWIHAIAQSLWREHSYGQSEGYPYPLYPLFVALVYSLGGPSFSLVFLAQAAVFAVIVGFAYQLTKQIAGRSAGVFSACLIMLDAALLGNVGLLIKENLQSALVLLAVLVHCLAFQRQRLGAHVGAGILWGLTTLVKPETVFWPLITLPVYLFHIRQRRLIVWAAFGLAFYGVLAPWLLRNALTPGVSITGYATPGTYTIGLRENYSPLLIHVLDEGEARHNAALLFPKFARVSADLKSRRILPGTVSFYVYTLGLLRERIQRSPSEYLSHVWSNFVYFWLEPPLNWPYVAYNTSFPKGYRQTPGYTDYVAMHVLLLGAASVSLLLLAVRRHPLGLLRILLLMYYALFYTFTFVEPRYSTPIIPVVLTTAGMFPFLLLQTARNKARSGGSGPNALFALILVVSIPGIILFSILNLNRFNVIADGGFESPDTGAWLYRQASGEVDTPVYDSYQAHRGFRSLTLQIGVAERGKETQILQQVPVWPDANYLISFSYTFVERRSSKSPFYVEVKEWDRDRENWRTILREWLPIISNTWVRQEYRFKTSSSAYAIAVVFGLYYEPAKVLLDSVDVRLIPSVRDLLQRPYLLQDIRKVNPNDYLPLKQWVLTQPEQNRDFLLKNPDVARQHGWRGEAPVPQLLVVASVLLAVVFWIALTLLFTRVRLFERAIISPAVPVLIYLAAGLFLAKKAAICYLLLFSNPS